MPNAAFNIVDYGAVGDNSTNCTTAIVAARDAAGAAGTVFVPAGIFRTDGITPLANQSWYMANGAVLYLRGATSPLWNCTAKGVRLFGGKLDNGSVDGHSAWFDATASPAATERGGGMWGVEMTGIPVASNGNKYSVYIAAQHTKIVDCFVHDTDNGIKFVAANVQILRNRIYKACWTGIAGEGAGNNVAKASRLRGCMVLNNTIIDSALDAGGAVHSFSIEIVNGFSQLEVAGNYIQGNNASMSFVGGYFLNLHDNHLLTSLLAPAVWVVEINGYDSNVHHNLIEGNGGSLVGFGQSGANAAGFFNDRSSFRGNTILDVQIGIQINWNPGFVVEDNTIHNASYGAIITGSNQGTGDVSSDGLISGNRISNDSAGSAIGIEILSGLADGTLIIGNKIKTVSFGYSLNGDNFLVVGNKTTGAGTAIAGSRTNYTQANNVPALP